MQTNLMEVHTPCFKERSVYGGGEGGDDSALEGQDRLEKNDEEK